MLSDLLAPVRLASEDAPELPDVLERDPRRLRRAGTTAEKMLAMATIPSVDAIPFRGCLSEGASPIRQTHRFMRGVENRLTEA